MDAGGWTVVERERDGDGHARDEHSQVFLASNAFWTLGRRLTPSPSGFSGSCTKGASSDLSHGFCRRSAAVGRLTGSTVRQARTKALAVSDTPAQYSAGANL